MAAPGDRSGFDAEGAKVTYDRLVNDRAPYTTRAEKNAEYTIPSLFPKASDNASTDYVTPYQSVGARGNNNLAAKMVLSTLPVGQPFYKLGMSEFDLKSTGDPNVAVQAQLGLSMIERIGMAYLEAAQLRPTTSELFKQLLVAGNGLLVLLPGEMKMKLYRLNAYVVERDASGTVLQIIMRDLVAYAALPEEVKSAIPEGEYKPETQVEIYTHVYLDSESDQWLAYQEVESEVVKGSENTYPRMASPYIPVRLYKLDGENYGRSFVEEYLGDLVSLENLSKAIVQFALVCSKILFLVKPGSQTSVRRLAKAASGDFIPGKPEDIAVFQLDKFADFQVAEKTAAGVEQRLSYAFLLNSAVQRNGDRVTAEEIRFVSQELEATLGGVYSILSSEFQLPLVQRLLVELQAQSKIPDLPEGALNPTVVTGIDAIGRGQDANKLNQFQAMIAPYIDKVSAKIDFDNLVLRAADACGLDPQGMIMTPEQVAAKTAEQAAQQGMLQAGAQAGATGGAGMGAAMTDPEAISAAVG